MCIISFSEMDESLDVSGIEESIHAAHSCECGYFTRDRSNYNRHIKKCKWHCRLGPSTSTPAKAIRDSPTQEETSACPGSSQQPTSSGSKQPTISTARQPFICDTCGKVFKTNYGMKLHIKSKHAMEFKHKCSMCDKTFNQTVQYRYHCSTHLNVQTDRCPHCKACFSSHGSLGRHLKTCSMNKDTFEKFTCETCGAPFPHKYRLTYHQRNGGNMERRSTRVKVAASRLPGDQV